MPKGIYSNGTRALARREDISPLEAFLVQRFQGRVSTVRDPNMIHYSMALVCVPAMAIAAILAFMARNRVRAMRPVA